MEKIFVSVVVITYNSAETIIETLESVKKQTYKNLELVITDDSSTDNSLKIIEDWLKENEKRFVIIQIVKSEINTGIVPNFIRGTKKATGEYIKYLSGDDLLLESCIEDSLKFCLENGYEVCVSKYISFTTIPDEEYERKMLAYGDKHMLKFARLNVKKQLKKLIKEYKISMIGFFIKNELWNKIGFPNEKYPMLDDYQFAFALVNAGIKINLLDKYEVKYRVRSKEEFEKISKTKRVSEHTCNLEKFREQILIPEAKKRGMYLVVYDYNIEKICNKFKKSEGIIRYFGNTIYFLSFKNINGEIRKIIKKIIKLLFGITLGS
ncbi:MAG: glycosyltransferase family 2 protein [Fusobacteriaceae bacterium]